MEEESGRITLDLKWPAADNIGAVVGKPCTDHLGRVIGEIVDTSYDDGKMTLHIEAVTDEQKRAYGSWCKALNMTKRVTFINPMR